MPNEDLNQNQQAESEESRLDNQIRLAADAVQVEPKDVLIVPVESPGFTGVAAFRVPKPAEWQRYREDVMSPEARVKLNAYRTLVLACCIYPPRPEFQSMVAARPGLVETFSGELVEHAGVASAKKVRTL